MPRYSKYQRYGELLGNSYYITTASNGANLIRNGLKSNDFLLHIHGITFADQLRHLKDNGINVKRRFYEQCRAGTEEPANIRFMGYFHTYWTRKGYSFDLHQFTDINFPSLFFNYYAGECHTLLLRFTSLSEVTPRPKAGRKKVLKS